VLVTEAIRELVIKTWILKMVPGYIIAKRAHKSKLLNAHLYHLKPPRVFDVITSLEIYGEAACEIDLVSQCDYILLFNKLNVYLSIVHGIGPW